MFGDGTHCPNGTRNLQLSSSLRDVNYSCGSCGYELNLNSCNRNTSVSVSKYEKSIKKGMISFFSIDESRFTQIGELRCIPYFNSRRSWGLFRRQTKLLCRKCKNQIGIAYEETHKANKSSSNFWDGITDVRMYDIKLRALQPSTSSEDNVSSYTFFGPLSFNY